MMKAKKLIVAKTHPLRSGSMAKLAKASNLYPRDPDSIFG
jgi:hypothetical protein